MNKNEELSNKVNKSLPVSNGNKKNLRAQLIKNINDSKTGTTVNRKRKKRIKSTSDYTNYPKIKKLQRKPLSDITNSSQCVLPKIDVLLLKEPISKENIYTETPTNNTGCVNSSLKINKLNPNAITVPIISSLILNLPRDNIHSPIVNPNFYLNGQPFAIENTAKKTATIDGKNVPDPTNTKTVAKRKRKGTTLKRKYKAKKSEPDLSKPEEELNVIKEPDLKGKDLKKTNIWEDINAIEKFPVQKQPEKRKRRCRRELTLAQNLVILPRRTRQSLEMSLYDRRYNDDSRSIVANGYMNSSRNSPANSNNMDSDSQDPYYMAPSSGSANNINGTPSMATLCNIGNSCYLNSVVYTLRFTPGFLHNLHHLIVDLNNIQKIIARQRAKSSSLGRDVASGNLEHARCWSNKDLASAEQYQSNSSGSVLANGQYIQKSSQQSLTEKLHELFQNLHRIEMNESLEPFHADTLLHAIQDVSTVFEGNQQQDAHEFLMCLMNSVRETSQKFLKSVKENPNVLETGHIKQFDESDVHSGSEKDASNASAGNGISSSSSLSTSNITKASFFSRKSRRKEESKNSKNSRLQSPLKDGGSNPAQYQATSNSFFYLNTVDLSGSNGQSTSNVNVESVPTISHSSHTQKAAESTIDEDMPLTGNSLKDKERLQERINELGLNFFSEDFEGITVSTTKCLSCETVTEQKESMIDIAVPVPPKDVDNFDCQEKAKSFIQNSCVTREVFRGENKYRCEQCTGYTEAIRSISYEKLPRLLVLQLSRFSGGMEKINSYVPTCFTIPCFCSKCCQLGEREKLHVYKLYSVITHVGATMTVGHYIAYTCPLDYSGEYVNCPKENRSNSNQDSAAINNKILNNSAGSDERNGSAQQSSSASSSASSFASSSTSIIKKMKFGRSKASSSGDMSKNVKNINGLTSKSITNGIGKLSMNATCSALNCCATRLCTLQHQQSAQLYQQNPSNNNDISEDSGVANGNLNFSYFPSGYGSTGRGSSRNHYSNSSVNSEPLWYMCDDDKIKVMTQREFEDILQPGRKSTITPYLLFYARFDARPSSASVGKQTVVTPTSSNVSWSNETNLQKM